MLLGARLGSFGGGAAPLPYDAEVEYLENDGVAWIDTGVPFGGYTLYNIDATLVSKISLPSCETTSTYRLAFVGTSILSGIGLARSSDVLRICVKGTSDSNSVLIDSDGAEMLVKLCFDSENGYVYKDGVLVGSTARGTGTTEFLDGITMPIFAGRYKSNGVIKTSKPLEHQVRVHSFYVRNNVTGEEFDGIPVRVGSVGYMYDRISGQLFGNVETSGAFILGPDK